MAENLFKKFGVDPGKTTVQQSPLGQQVPDPLAIAQTMLSPPKPKAENLFKKFGVDPKTYKPPKPPEQSPGLFREAVATVAPVAESLLNIGPSIANVADAATGGLLNRGYQWLQKTIAEALPETEAEKQYGGYTLPLEQAPTLAEGAARARDFIREATETPGLKAQREELGQAKGFIEPVKTLLANPQLLAAEGLGALAYMLPIMAAGRVAGLPGIVGANVGISGGTSGLAAQEQFLNMPEKELMEVSPRYQDLRKDMGDREARLQLLNDINRVTTATSGALGGGATLLTGGGAPGAFIGQSAGALAKAGIISPKAANSLLGRIGEGMLREGVEETLQSGGERFGENVGLRRVDPTQRLGEGVPEAMAIGGTLGAVTGGAFGGLTPRRPTPEATPPPERNIIGAGPLTGLPRGGGRPPALPQQGGLIRPEPILDLSGLVRVEGVEGPVRVVSMRDPNTAVVENMAGERADVPVSEIRNFITQRPSTGPDFELVPKEQEYQYEGGIPFEPGLAVPRPTEQQARRYLNVPDINAKPGGLPLPQGTETPGLYRPTPQTSPALAQSKAERDAAELKAVEEEIAWLRGQTPTNPAMQEALNKAMNEREKRRRVLIKGIPGQDKPVPGKPKGLPEKPQIQRPQRQPKKAEQFKPTHSLPDNTLVRPNIDESGNAVSNEWVDAEGTIYEDDNAELINAETVRSNEGQIQGKGNVGQAGQAEGGPDIQQQTPEETRDEEGAQIEELGTRRRVGAAGQSVLTSRAVDESGTGYELWDAENGKSSVRIFDTDTGQIVHVVTYPNKAKAQTAFDEAVNKSGARAEYAVEPEGAQIEEGPFPEPTNATQARDRLAWAGRRQQDLERIAGVRQPVVEGVTNEEREAARIQADAYKQEADSLRELMRTFEKNDKAAQEPLSRSERTRRRLAEKAKIQDTDTVLTAIAKLGGINRDLAKKEGFDPADMKQARSGVFGLPVFRAKGGMALDDMATRLEELGFITQGGYSKDALLDLVDKALRGETVRTARGTELTAEESTDEREEETAGVQLPPDELDNVAPSLEFSPSDLDDSGYRDATDLQKAIAEAYDQAAAVIGEDAAEAVIERITIQNENIDDQALTKAIRDELAKQARRSQERDTDRQEPVSTPEEILASYTEEELAQRAAEQEAADKAETEARQAAEKKAKADQERGEFELTGSDRPADRFGNRQGDVFDQAKKKEPTTDKGDAIAKNWIERTLSINPDGPIITKNYAEIHIKPLARRLVKAKEWKSADELTVINRAGKRDVSTTNNNLNELIELGAVIRGWDNQGTPFYALAGTPVPEWITTDANISEEALAKLPAKAGPETAKPEKRQESAEEKAAVEKKGPVTYETHKETVSRINKGNITADELKTEFKRLVDSETDIKAELKKKKLKELTGGTGRTGGLNKAQLIDNIYSRMLQRYVLADSFSWSPFTEDLKTAVQRYVSQTTNEDIQQYADARKKAAQDHQKALNNPETLSEFQRFIGFRGEGALSDEQRATYEKLQAEQLKEARQRDDSTKARSTLTGEGINSQLRETKHTRDGYDLYVVQLDERVDKDTYRSILGHAKQLGGWYSKFNKQGAIPGFQFKDKASAEQFQKLIAKDETVIQEAVQQAAEKAEAKIAAHQEAAAKRLKKQAEKLAEKANETLNADRQTNTARRANMAASIENRARKDLAMANTMQNLAAAIETGETEFLQNITTRKHVEELDSRARQAMYRYNQAKEVPYSKTKGMEPSVEHIQYAEMPVINTDARVSIPSKLAALPGGKGLAARFRNESHPTIKDAEKARQLLGESVSTHEGLIRYIENTNRLNRMGIYTDAELRTAIREYLQFRSEKQTEDPVKKMERALIGTKPGIDFFPTPGMLARELVKRANIKPGMDVLEPSAGKGDIADAIRNTVPDVNLETVELSGTLRELLKAKGHNVTNSDFMTHEGVYDRIVMNPPFSNGQDAEHVRHAYDLLKPGGRLVAITGEGIHFRNDKKAREFVEWLEENNGTAEKLPEGSFKSSFRPTGVATRLVILEKPVEQPSNQESASQKPSKQDETKYSRAQTTPYTSTDNLKADLEATFGKGIVNRLKRVTILDAVPEGHPADAAGITFGDGTIALVAPNIAKGKASDVLLHEAVHAGLREAIGDTAFKNVLLGVSEKSGTVFARARQRAQESLGENADPLLLAEETVAYLIEETGAKLPVVRRIIARIRHYLRKMGLVKEYTEADLVDMVRMTLRRMAREEAITLPDGKLAYYSQTFPERIEQIQKSIVDSPAFKRWFGESKVTTEEGQPKRVYHGSMSGQIHAFDPYKVDNAALFGPGFYFTESSEVAGEYTDKGVRQVRHNFTRDNEMDARRFANDLRRRTEGEVTVSKDAKTRKWNIHIKQDMPGYEKTVYPLYLSIEKPFDVEGTLTDKEVTELEKIARIKIPGRGGEEVYNAIAEKLGKVATRAVLMKAGYDGITHIGGRYLGKQMGLGDRSHKVWIAFRQGQIKSSVGNIGTFDKANPNIRYSRSTGNPQLDGFYEQAGLNDKPTVTEKIRDLWSLDPALKKQAAKQKGRETVEAAFDKFNRVKQILEDRGMNASDAARSGYVKLRMSTALGSIMHATLLKSSVQVSPEGVLTPKGTKGLLDTLKPVMDNPELFREWLAYRAAKRANRLMGEGRERNFTQDQIDAVLNHVNRDPAKKQLFDQTWRDADRFQNDVLNVAVDMGLLDNQTKRTWQQYGDYIPFYRALEDTITGPGGGKGYSHQQASRRLYGGESRTNDLFQNMVMNISHLIEASLKNQAIAQVRTNLPDLFTKLGPQFQRARIPRSEIRKFLKEDPEFAQFFQQFQIDESAIDALPPEVWDGIQKMWAMKPPVGDDVVRIMEAGKPVYYRVEDAELADMLTNLNTNTIGNWIKPFQMAKRLLTIGATSNPTFWARNLARDIVQAKLIYPDLTFKEIFKGVRQSLLERGKAVDMAIAGASFQGGYINANDPGEMERTIRAALRQSGMPSVRGSKGFVFDWTTQAWEKYMQIGFRVENAVREAVFEHVLNKTGSRAQAAYEARDLMDYSLQGKAAAMQILTRTIPFLNARMQGLSKLTRAHRADRRVAARGLAIALVSAMLLAFNKDDERYKALEEWERDMHWHIFFPEDIGLPDELTHIKIPKPFELGAIYGTLLGERLPMAFINAAGGEGDRADQTKDALWRMMCDTFAIDWRPQLVRPIIEVQANYSSFFQRPIEGMSDEGKLPAARYDAFTSPTMKALGQAISNETGLSPKELEHLWRGYTGTMGMYLLTVSDWMTRLANNEPLPPASQIGDYPLMRAFLKTSSKHTRYQSEFYDIRQNLEQIYRTIQAYQKEQRTDEAYKLWQDNREKLQYRPMVQAASQQILDIRKQMDRVYRSSMTRSEKRERINVLQDMINAVAERVSGHAAEAVL